MSKKVNLPWLVSLLIGFSILIFSFLVLWLGVRNRLDVSQPFRDVYIPVREKSLEQSFTANHDFINIIILYFKNPGLANKGDFQFVLKSAEGKVLVERPFSGYNIGDPSDIRFQFDPIASSKGKKFTIAVRNNSLTEPEVSLGSDSEKGLSFSVYYRTNNKKLALRELLSSFSNRMFSDKTFFIFWCLGFLAILVGARQRKKG